MQIGDMVLRSRTGFPLLLLAAGLGGCNPLDRVDILAGDKCRFPEEDRPVACVLDGDTIVLDDCETGETIRLLGVDAPEIEHPDQVEECFGPEAAAYMTDLVLGEYVTLRFDAECTDKYERTLAYVYLPPDAGSDKEILVNDLVIRQGYAEFYEEFGDILLASILQDAQTAAQNGNNGLWAECY